MDNIYIGVLLGSFYLILIAVAIWGISNALRLPKEGADKGSAG